MQIIFLPGMGIHPSNAESLVLLLKNEGYSVICTSSKKHKLPRLINMLSTFYYNRKKSAALIAVYSSTAFYFALACSMLCRLLRINYIACLHGGNLPQRIKSSTPLCAQIFKNSFMNVAVSGYLQNFMKEKKWHCIVIKNPIYLHQYPFKQRSKCKPKLLWVRSFHEIYNPALALHILQQLRQIYKNAELTMVGPDKDGSFKACKQLSRKLQLESHVEFTGLLKKNEWITCSAHHDFFINTSNLDNAPVSITEAMALGMLVVSANVGGMRYMINHNENGMLVAPNDAAGFVQAIDILLRDATLAEKISSNARIAAAQYDVSIIKNEWNKLLRNS